MAPLSLEALQDLALRVRAAGIARLRARLRNHGEAPAGTPAPAPAPDGSSLAAAYTTALAADRATGVLLAEASVVDALRRPERAYTAAWVKDPVTLPRDVTLRPDALPPCASTYSTQAQRALVGRTSARPRRPRRSRDKRASTTSMPANGIRSRGVLRLDTKGAMPSATGLTFESSLTNATHSSMSASVSVGSPTMR